MSGPRDLFVALNEVWNREGVDAVAERFWTDDVVWEDAADAPDRSIHSGRAAVAEYLRTLTATMGDIPIELVRFIDVDDRQGVAVTRTRSTTRSGVPLDWAVAQLVTITGGRFSRVRIFLDAGEAERVARSEAMSG
jgi:ketosteroid isomerase-like protein